MSSSCLNEITAYRLWTPFCFTSFASFRVIVGGRTEVSSFLNSEIASVGFFLTVRSPPAIFSGRSGNEMKTTRSPLPSEFKKISCSMLKQPVVHRQHARITAYPRRNLTFIIVPFLKHFYEW